MAGDEAHTFFWKSRDLSSSKQRSEMMRIRDADIADHDAIWAILEPTIRDGSTLTLPRDMTREAALDYWCHPDHAVFVAIDNSRLVGTFYLRANARAGGAHVANCGYVTAPWAMGRGVARAMCVFSFDRARERGFRAMQFNFVVATNEAAIHLWQSCGMAIVGRLPGAFLHPTEGYVDALVMYRTL
jgi:ribosomal protein S18 acetylase RimI-like enzyme